MPCSRKRSRVNGVLCCAATEAVELFHCSWFDWCGQAKSVEIQAQVGSTHMLSQKLSSQICAEKKKVCTPGGARTRGH